MPKVKLVKHSGEWFFLYWHLTGIERYTVNRHMTLKQYRNLDLFLFAVMLIISESLIVNAAIRWFPDQLYTVSVCAAIVSIVLMRWGPWAAVHAVLGGLVYCFWAGGTPKQYLIYMVGKRHSITINQPLSN